MNIRPIRTEKDHQWALGELEQLWDKAGTQTPEGERFEVLATLVDHYEGERFPIACPDPIAAIRFRMEQGGVTPEDLRLVFRSTARTSEIMNRKRHLSIRMIRALHQRFAIPLECLVVDYELSQSSSRGKDSRPPR